MYGRKGSEDVPLNIHAIGGEHITAEMAIVSIIVSKESLRLRLRELFSRV